MQQTRNEVSLFLTDILLILNSSSLCQCLQQILVSFIFFPLQNYGSSCCRDGQFKKKMVQENYSPNVEHIIVWGKQHELHYVCWSESSTVMYLIISRIRVFPLLLTGTHLLATSSPRKYSNCRLLRKLELSGSLPILLHSRATIFFQKSRRQIFPTQKMHGDYTEWYLRQVFYVWVFSKWPFCKIEETKNVFCD